MKLLINKEKIFLKPAFVEKLWGGQKLNTLFDFDIPPGKSIGEAWLISARDEAMSYVAKGKYHGLSLKQLYETKPQLFGHPQFKEYPLLTKILDANDNLSVQFHPNDEHIKTECWYVLDCADDQEVIYGHHAQNKSQLRDWLTEDHFEQLFNYLPIETGQFIYVPALKVHGLLQDTVVFELQQSSNTTYRLYDYERTDAQKKPRQLHLETARQIIDTPDQNRSEANGHDNYLVDNEMFKLVKIENNKRTKYAFPNAKWLQMTVLKGEGKIDKTKIKIGDSFILPNGYNKFKVDGELLIMLSYV